MKKHFNKNLIMNEEKENFSQITLVGFIKKLIHNDDEKVRDH